MSDSQNAVKDAAWSAYCAAPTARDMGRSKVDAAIDAALQHAQQADREAVAAVYKLPTGESRLDFTSDRFRDLPDGTKLYARSAASSTEQPASQQGGVPDDNTIASLARTHFDGTVANRLTFERSPERYPENTGWTPTTELAAFVKAIVAATLTAAPSTAGADGWQPIETAPTHGAIRLVVETDCSTHPERRVFCAEQSFSEGAGWHWLVTTGWIGWLPLHSGWRPIGWKHLPVPPLPAAAKEGKQPC